MSAFFSYDCLTWPEVQALPRSTPLVLPLGHGYPLDLLAAALGNPAQAGLLPALPFGWPGSPLPVPLPVLEALLANLLAGLQQDGFTRAVILAPEGMQLSAGLPHLLLPAAQSAEMPGEADRDKVVLLSAGQTEQHGFHLPLSTDTLIIDAVAQETARRAPQAAVALPVFPYGVSMHRQAFAGTLNCGGRAFEDFWLAVLDRLVERGFQRFYLLSGHGGNCSFFTTVVKYIGERYPAIFCATAWLYLSGPRGIAALEARRESAVGGMGHACELETSLILHLHPEWVHMERVVDETGFITTPAYYMDWIEGGALVANPPWEDDTQTGAYGAGSLGTAEKGRFWLDAAVEEKVEHVVEIIQQHRLRAARRIARMSQ